MNNRFWSAYMIQQGACNPSGVARALVEAIDQTREENPDTANISADPAVRMIAHQLAHILRLSEYDFDLNAYSRDYAICKERGGVQ